MKGLIAWFARNGVAANLLLGGIVAAGLYTLASDKIPLEVFPTFDVNEVSIVVPYRGSTPEEIEETVVVRVEEAIADVEGIERIQSTASENNAVIRIEVDDDYDRREVLDDLKGRVDAISTFPADAEKPVISLPQGYRSVISVVLFGKMSERDLRSLGERVRDEIAGLPKVTNANLQGIRPYEISIEIDESSLQRYGLSFDRVSQALRNSSIDVPAGTLKTEAGEIVLRSKGRAYSGPEFERIVILSRGDGTRVLLGDIAKVNDGFNENPFLARFHPGGEGESAAAGSQRCVIIAVSREGNQNAIQIANQVKDYMNEARLPEGVNLAYWSDSSRIVKGRLNTLVDSAWKSMVFVFLVLTLFLRPSLAFWVVVGIPVCFLGSIALMPLFGVSINVVSLFGFILVLGVVVDDAIVTGENVYTHQMRGSDPLTASAVGTKEVALPVIFGILTTVLAFFPLLLGSGFQGRANRDIALIVIPVLIFSLIESKLILPSHLTHCRFAKEPGSFLKYFYRFQQFFANGLETFIKKVYQPILGKALDYRYFSLALFVAAFMILIGSIIAGKVKRVSFPRVASERATATLKMQEGTPYEITKGHVDRMMDIVDDLREEYRGPDGTSVIEKMISGSGGQGLTSSRRRNTQGESHLGEVTFYTTPPEERGKTSNKINIRDIVSEWRKRIGPIIGAKELNFRAEIGRGGDPIDIQLTAPNLDDLTAAAVDIKAHLTEYAGVFDISDSLDDTNEEIQLSIKAEGQQFGLTQSMLARQIRQGFYGEEIQRTQRGRDEVRVMLRYPERTRKTLNSLQAMRIRTPDGDEVPFTSVAEAKITKSFPTITRIDRNRAINITADVDKDNSDLPAIKEGVMAFTETAIQKYGGMNFSLEGEARDARENSAATRSGALLIIFGIYAMLAIPFRSYLQPLIVMSVIPFGLIGAVMGHLIEGLSLSFLSYFGMLALAGVVVNDSLVLVDYVNRRRREGVPLFEAVYNAGGARFRPIMLTSLTTFAGLYPLIRLESTQAQFLIPMAVSLGYGILFATLITIFLVPINYLILEDIRSIFSRLYGSDKSASPEEKLPRVKPQPSS